MTGLVTLKDLSTEDLLGLLDRAERFADVLRDGETIPRLLDASTVTTVFFEPSTRTRLSFESAAARLGAHVISFTPEQSSTEKGETLRDTLMTLAAMGSSLLVVRHGQSDVPALAQRWTGLPVVNAGAGRAEHPTQTLVDALTLRRHFGRLQGLRMAIVGDVANSRVARGHLEALPRLGVEVTLVGPTSLLPRHNPWKVPTTTNLDEELGDVDVVYLLRIQKERGASQGYPSDSGYSRRFGLGAGRLSSMKPGAVIMHPGPLNRGVEIDDVAADSEQSLILAQVANGVPVRMAVLARALGVEP